MKKVIGILFGIAVLTVLVLTPPGETVKMYEKQSIETVQVDVINIDGVELQSVNFFNPIDVLEVGIMPGYSSGCMYIAKYSIHKNTNSIETDRLYGTNYFLHSFRLNSDPATTQLHQIAKKHKDYKGVGIPPGLILGHRNDATT